MRWKLLRLRGAPQLRELYSAELQGVLLVPEPGVVRRLEGAMGKPSEPWTAQHEEVSASAAISDGVEELSALQRRA